MFEFLLIRKVAIFGAKIQIVLEKISKSYFCVKIHFLGNFSNTVQWKSVFRICQFVCQSLPSSFVVIPKKMHSIIYTRKNPIKRTRIGNTEEQSN